MMPLTELPPLRNLPSWSRVSDLDATVYPAPPPACTRAPASPHSIRERATQTSAVGDADRARVATLEKDLRFLQQAHRNTLKNLHEELEHLRRAHKDSTAGGVHEKGTQSPTISSAEDMTSSGHPVKPSVAIVTSLHPLKIETSVSGPPRTPTLQECEAIILQLYHTNLAQSQELVQVKSTLRDMVLNKKQFSPQMRSQSKARQSGTSSEMLGNFPKRSYKPIPKIQRSDTGTRQKPVLPALRGTLNSLTERQRRAQDVHNTRVRRCIF